MLKRLRTGAGVGVLTFAFAAPAAAYFLPKHANYDGGTNHGGSLHFKVRKHNIILITGALPIPKGQTCEYAAKHRIPLRLEEYDPAGNAHFSIDASQYVNPHTKRWRHLKMHLEGQFDSAAQNASGTVRATLHDRHAGKCQTRNDLAWQLHRRS